MSLPKILYVVEREGTDDTWLDAGRDKFSRVEKDGDIVGTYILQKKEKGMRLVKFKDVK